MQMEMGEKRTNNGVKKEAKHHRSATGTTSQDGLTEHAPIMHATRNTRTATTPHVLATGVLCSYRRLGPFEAGGPTQGRKCPEGRARVLHGGQETVVVSAARVGKHPRGDGGVCAWCGLMGWLQHEFATMRRW